ncbi:DNA polymerase delta2 [Cryptosporidium canis]|uniref:DNA polymerase delta2 n=1 Tax=Cryptosporidium canis TaxID=195482 RepID=A0A9D5DIF7_9CRYT|nr:DNA polymerase delta2 [Cryptosporidium canis]
MSLRPFLLNAAQRRWECHVLGSEEIEGSQMKESVPILNQLKEIRMESECVVLGLINKEMKNRPTILDEYLQNIEDSAKSRQLVNYMSDDDRLYLEDSSSRVPLVLDEVLFSVHDLISGTVVAVRGIQNSGGNFVVSDLTFASPPEGIIGPGPLGRSSLPIYLGFVSGLNIGSGSENSLSMQMFRDFIMGVSSYSEEHRLLSSRIAHLIIAGNTVQLLDTAKETNTGTGTKLVVNHELLSSRLGVVDSFISQLASCISVAIMPGDNDPVPISLPQSPFQPYIFKNSRNYQSFKSFTNPCLFSVDGVRVAGASGQCISKISLFSSYSKPIDALKFCVESRNIAPTCPDAVPSYPFFDRDPFALDFSDDSFPHVIFAGGQSEFESYRFPNNGPVCFTIPEFSSTPTLVLLDICSFEFKTVSFKLDPQP